MEFKSLVKNTSFLMSTKFVQFFAGMLRAKINAVLLGTVGVGVFNQLAFVVNRMYQLTTLGMGEAVVKEIAGNKDQEKVSEIINKSLKSYILLSFIFLMISSVVLFMFTDKLTVYIFGDLEYRNYYFLGILSIPILIINSIPFSILRSFKDVKSISRARIGVILVNLILFIPFVFIGKLDGAAIFLPLSFIVTLLFNYWFARKKYFKLYGISVKSILMTPLSTMITKEILIFSGFGLIIATYGIFHDFFTRSLVVTHLGIDKIGVYSPIVKWFGLFTGFIMPSFQTYLFPRYSEVVSNMEFRGIINDSLRLCTLMMLPLLMIAIPYRYVLIELFYSKEFLEAGLYLPYHFFGRVFFVWFFAMAVALKPTGMIKWHTILYVILYSINMLLAYVFIPKYGLYGLVLSSTVGVFLMFFVVWRFLKRTSEFRIDVSNKILMSYLLGASLVLIFIDNYFSIESLNYFLGPLFLLLTFFFLTTNEKKFVFKKVAPLYHKFRKRK